MKKWNELTKEEKNKIALEFALNEGCTGNRLEPDDGCDSPEEYYFYKSTINQPFEPYQKGDENIY